MRQATTGRALAALLAGSLLLGACNGTGNAGTSTPTSTLGTESAAEKVGGVAADTSATTTTMGAPASRVTSTPATTMGTGQ